MERTTLDVYYELHKHFYDMYDSYVADYYVEEHWNKLPSLWQSHFSKGELSSLENLLDPNCPLLEMLPLSLLALRQAVLIFTTERRQRHINISEEQKHFAKILQKGIKEKKRHEIDIIAKLCHNKAIETDCFNIVDIGSGLGHLSRLLAYYYGFKVCTFEAQEKLTESAQLLDIQFEKVLQKKGKFNEKFKRPVHINKRITKEMDVKEFIDIVQIGLNENNIKFGLVGLHPCGDLGPILLKLFNNCPNIVFVNIASCCYMKMTLGPLESNFPLSSYGRKREFCLNYLSCEIACHALENYVTKLNLPSCKLKVHAFRAGLEFILSKYYPQMRHIQLSNVKYKENLPFSQYCSKALAKTDIDLSPCHKDIELMDIEIDSSWKKVVIFYSLRLLLAPIVENIILLDRSLYILENGYVCEIISAFDPIISPRNQIISAKKIMQK